MIRCLLVAMLTVGWQPAAAGAAQDPAQGAPPQTQAPRDLSPAEIQRWFSAYALLQAQEALGLTDEQYPRFLTAMKAFQERQRQSRQERVRLLREINRVSGPDAAADDAAINAALTALRQHDSKAEGELQKAYDRVDETLTVRQRARFRLFEEQMERRKIELLMRVRQPQRRNPDRPVR